MTKKAMWHDFRLSDVHMLVFCCCCCLREKNNKTNSKKAQFVFTLGGRTLNVQRSIMQLRSWYMIKTKCTTEEKECMKYLPHLSPRPCQEFCHLSISSWCTMLLEPYPRRRVKVSVKINVALQDISLVIQQ